ncbi:hypothetical protein [Agrococcus jejuensis]|uniref:hypothetical protein n=1 Tax=Agrococcus jejuensis TaxID=399736 RepID=UPI0011A915EC|nr:hypothetical protein [Agrococcus jejuensis]
MPRIRATLALAIAALVAPLAACVAGPPASPPAPTADATAIVAVLATQSPGPLGDGSEGIERTDATSIAALADVLAMTRTDPEDVECVWSTRTTVEVTFDDASTTRLQADSCGATGRDEALGLLVAEWVLEEG